MLNYMKKTVREAGKIAMKYYGRLQQTDIDYKNPIDLVTVADKKIEEFLKKKLYKKFPDVYFLGEEGSPGDSGGHARRFIADPLDGTTNFVHTYPFFSIALAYQENNETRTAVVYLPYFDSMYWAEKGKGAYCDNKRIQVSKTEKLLQSLVVTGFACVRAGEKPDNVPYFSKVIYNTRGIRRDGSAAIDLCYVAQGTFDLFWEMHLGIWDIAAGGLIVQEAGGRISDFNNSDQQESRKEILASNGLVHEEFLKIINEK